MHYLLLNKKRKKSYFCMKEKELLYIQKRTLAYYSNFIYNVSLLLSYNISITEKLFI